MKNNTVKQTKSIDENIESLRELLSVDTLLYDIDGPAAIRILETLSQQITKMQTEAEELQDALEVSDKECNDYSEKIEELKEQIEDLEGKVEAAKSTDGCLVIRMDSMVLQDKLENYVKTEIYPYYNQQVANLNF